MPPAAIIIFAATLSSAPRALLDVPVLVGSRSAISWTELAAVLVEATRFRPSLRRIGETAANLTSDQDPGACGSDLRCISERARAAGAELALLAIANTNDDGVVLAVRILDAERSELVAGASRVLPANASKPELLEQAAAAAREALEASGHPEWGALTVWVEPPDARVTTGDPSGSNPAGTELLLPAGRHALLIEREGFIAKRETAEVTAGRKRDVKIALERDVDPLASPWLWIGAGAALVAAGIAAAVVAGGSSAPCMCLSLSSPCPDDC